MRLEKPSILAPILCIPLLCGAVPAAAATITVNDASDTLHSPGCATTGTGTCSLRDAITFSNANGGAAAIHFGISGAGVHTISPATALPSITDPVTIDGTTQGASATPLIELSGAGAPAGTDGLTITAGSTTVRGLAINRWATNGFGGGGIVISTAGGNVIRGNFIGTTADGTAAASNGGVGIRVGSDSNTIGGLAAADRNVVSANFVGIVIDGNNNLLTGNFVGTDGAGTAGLANNYDGVQVTGSNNTIGGTAASARNVLSGNARAGIWIDGGNGNKVEGNLVGLDSGGVNKLANANYGVWISGGNNNTVGGEADGAGNTIAFNYQNVAIFSGTGNAILRNSNSSSFYYGINLNNDGVTANDPCDADGGANNSQNYPVLTSVSSDGTSTHIQGTLNSVSSTDYRIEFFVNDACNSFGNGDGKTFIGFATATTNGSCTAPVDVVLPVGVDASQVVTATATDPGGNTSEFSACQPLDGTLTPDALIADLDGDLIFQPGETATIRPTWRDSSPIGRSFTATASDFGGPAGPTYTIVDDHAVFHVNAKSAGYCIDCYSFFVSDPGTRPATHWDTAFTETLSIPGIAKVWKLHIGNSFSDVPSNFGFYQKIETVFHNGITVGCTPNTYCPFDKVPRSQMAIFIARGIAKGGANVPASGVVSGHPYNCVSGGVSLFTDVAPTDIACKSVHYIAAQNVTTGCSTARYCPSDNVTRAQMAIFIAKAIVAPAGGAGVPTTYGPDPVTHLSYSCNAGSPNLHFTDVLVSDNFCKHVHYLWAKGVIAGCSSDTYCPNGDVSRQEMAKFLSNGFNLQLYGP
jgi:hypothetical protein